MSWYSEEEKTPRIPRRLENVISDIFILSVAL